MSSDWIGQAHSALLAEDFHSAAYAAREAARSGDTAETWYLRSRASLGLGNPSDAAYEARQAVALSPNDASLHFNLAVVSDELEDRRTALQAFQKAASLSPGNGGYQAAYAGAIVDSGDLAQGTGMLRGLKQQFPADQAVDFHLALALLEAADEVAKVQNVDGFMVTSQDEVDKIRSLSQEARDLSADGDVQTRASELLQYVRKMEQRTLRLHNIFLMRGGPIRWGFAILVVILIGFWFTSISGLMGTVMVFTGILIGALVFGTGWVPQWKANVRNKKAVEGRLF